MEGLKVDCGVDSLSDGNPEEQFKSILSSLVMNTMNLNQDSCKYFAVLLFTDLSRKSNMDKYSFCKCYSSIIETTRQSITNIKNSLRYNYILQVRELHLIQFVLASN